MVKTLLTAVASSISNIILPEARPMVVESNRGGVLTTTTVVQVRAFFCVNNCDENMKTLSGWLP